jgi:hypothetical protein
MVIGQTLNNNDLPMYGCHVIGSDWYFKTLEGKQFCLNRDYSALTDEIFEIYRILKSLKQLIQSRWNRRKIDVTIECKLKLKLPRHQYKRQKALKTRNFKGFFYLYPLFWLFHSLNLHSCLKKIENSDFFKIPLQLEYIYPKGRLKPIFAYGFSLFSFATVDFMAGVNVEVSEKITFGLNYEADFIPNAYLVIVPSIFSSQSALLGLKIKL